jgi:hypothetical protein
MPHGVARDFRLRPVSSLAPDDRSTPQERPFLLAEQGGRATRDHFPAVTGLGVGGSSSMMLSSSNLTGSGPWSPLASPPPFFVPT